MPQAFCPTPSAMRNKLPFSMVRVVEIHDIEQLAEYRLEWGELLETTPVATFFQSLEWLETYWRHYGATQRLRTMIVFADDRVVGIVPLVVRLETTRIGQVRVLTYPLHDWGSFYGPIGPDTDLILAAACDHIHRTPRDWDIFELRWQGAIGTDPRQAERAMLHAGFCAYPTVWDRTAIVEMSGSWESYWASRKSAWLQRFRHCERKLAEQGEISYVRYRPAGRSHGDGSPRWDLYDACEEIARRSWQGSATDGTTLSHEPVREFLRETHEAAAAAGAVDLNLLLLAGQPVAFLYNYYSRGYVYGLRCGYDAQQSREGAGNVLFARALHDSFIRGDRIYDLGVGSLKGKRHLQTRIVPILRYSHFPPLALRAQLLRLKRWWDARRNPAFIAVGRDRNLTADAR
jgi:CelD/BcsL family acetyltransferase involved in cellulose biosynthesis